MKIEKAIEQSKIDFHNIRKVAEKRLVPTTYENLSTESLRSQGSTEINQFVSLVVAAAEHVAQSLGIDPNNIELDTSIIGEVFSLIEKKKNVF